MNVVRSVGDQHVSEAMVIRFRCSSERIEKFGGSFFWKMKCHPVCPFSIARVRVDDETLGSALNSGGESVGASNGRRQIFKIAFQFVAVCACLGGTPGPLSLSTLRTRIRSRVVFERSPDTWMSRRRTSRQEMQERRRCASRHIRLRTGMLS
jgi:hypothetical protein